MSNNPLNNKSLNDFLITESAAGNDSLLTIENTSNTASSSARLIVSANNASTSDEYVRYAVGTTNQFATGIDNSDSKKFKIAHGTSSTTPSSTAVYSADSVGRINKPLTPAFRAYLSTTKTNVTGSGQEYVVPFDTKNFDVGSNFNTTTGVFTAPIAGKYLFLSFVRGDDVQSLTTLGIGKLAILVNGTEYNQFYFGTETPTGSESEGNQLTFYTFAYISLNASDQVSVAFTNDLATTPTAVKGGIAYTYFAGFLFG